MSGELVIDVTEESFESAVVERSHTVPVLVDFWAAWCGPCRMLGPVLERLAVEYDGAFVLARLDTDANQALAARYRITGIPACKLFRGGTVVAEFTGALPEAQVRRFLDQHCPSEADQLAEAGDALARGGKLDEAAEAYRRALAARAGHGDALLGLARLALARGDLDETSARIDAIDAREDAHEAAQILGKSLGLARVCHEGGGLEACRARAAGSPDDLGARFRLAACQITAGDYRAALDNLLAIVETDRRHDDEAARKAMLVVFDMLGPRDPLTRDYRSRLAMILH